MDWWDIMERLRQQAEAIREAVEVSERITEGWVQANRYGQIDGAVASLIKTRKAQRDLVGRLATSGLLESREGLIDALDRSGHLEAVQGLNSDLMPRLGTALAGKMLQTIEERERAIDVDRVLSLQRSIAESSVAAISIDDSRLRWIEDNASSIRDTLSRITEVADSLDSEYWDVLGTASALVLENFDYLSEDDSEDDLDIEEKIEARHRELLKTARDLGEKGRGHRSSKIEDLVELFHYYKEQSSPVARKIISLLAQLLIAYVVSFSSAMHINYITNSQGKPGLKPSKAAEIWVKEEVAEREISSDILKDLRVVVRVKEPLPIKEKKALRSLTLKELHCGDVVALAKRDKNWSLVTWSKENPDGEDVSVKGWVLSRYLKRIDRP